MIVQPASDTVIHQYGHEWSRHEIGEQPFNNIITLYLQINEVFKLCFVGF